MRQALTALIAMTWMLIACADTALAQPLPITVGFRNRSDVNVIVKGYTIVNGQPRAGGNLQLAKKDGIAFERNVPPGVRYYTVYDPNTFRILIRDHPVPIQNRDVSLLIVPSPNNPGRLIIVVDNGP